jgi:hypothetical protein
MVGDPHVDPLAGIIKRKPIPFWGAANDPYGRVPMVPYVPESYGDRLVRKEFAQIGRAEFENDGAVQAIGREVVADAALRQPLPESSPSDRVNEGMRDTRSGLPSEGPVLDSQQLETNRLIDRAAKYYADLDEAKAIRRHKEPLGLGEEPGDGDEK